MFLFGEELNRLISAVHADTSVQVVAPWGVGASTFLRAASRRLEREDYVVLAVSGAYHSRHVEYFGLQRMTAGAVEPSGARTFLSLVELTVAYLQARPLTAIVIDAVEYVDRGTLSVIQVARERTGTPVIVGRSRDVRSIVSSGSTFTQFRGPQIELKPLDFVGTASLLYDLLGNRPDAEVASRVFAKSSGITGLAVALIAGAKSNGLIRLVDGQWEMAASTLWNSEADSWIEEHLALLTPLEYDTFERIAVASPSARAGDRVALDPAALRSLGALGLLAVSNPPGSSRILAQIPAMSSYFSRSRGGDAVRTYISGWGVTDAAPGADRDDRESTNGNLAPEVSAFRTALERKTLELSEVWAAAPAVKTAIPYLAALLDLPRTERTIRAVFEKTILSGDATPGDTFDFVYLYHDWASRSGVTHPRPFRYSDVAALFPDWAASIEMFVALTQNGPPEVAVTCERGDPERGGDLVAAAYAFAYLLSGDLIAARSWAGLVSDSEQFVVRKHRRFVESAVIFADGDHQTAMESSVEQIEIARRDADHNGILVHSYTLTLSLVAVARWPEARQAITAALAYGPPAAADGVLYRALLYIGAFLDLSAGDVALALRSVSEAERMDVRDVGLPGMQKEFSPILRSIIDGKPGIAMRRLRALASRLDGTGGHFAATMTLGLGLMFWPEEETLDQLEEAQHAAGAGYPAAVYDIVRQSFSNLHEAARAVIDLNDVASLSFLARLMAARVRQDTERGVRVEARIVDLLAVLETSLPLANAGENFPSVEGAAGRPSGLTSREVQVTLLVRTYSNVAIARRLGVSVRTIENHIQRAMKKTDSATRADLYQSVAFGEAPLLS